MSSNNLQAAGGNDTIRRFDDINAVENYIFSLSEGAREPCIRASHKVNASQNRIGLDEPTSVEPIGVIKAVTIRQKYTIYILEHKDGGLYLLNPLKGSGPGNTMHYAAWMETGSFAARGNIFAPKAKRAESDIKKDKTQQLSTSSSKGRKGTPRSSKRKRGAETDSGVQSESADVGIEEQAREGNELKDSNKSTDFKNESSAGPKPKIQRLRLTYKAREVDANAAAAATTTTNTDTAAKRPRKRGRPRKNPVAARQTADDVLAGAQALIDAAGQNTSDSEAGGITSEANGTATQPLPCKIPAR